MADVFIGESSGEFEDRIAGSGEARSAKFHEMTRKGMTRFVGMRRAHAISVASHMFHSASLLQDEVNDI